MTTSNPTTPSGELETLENPDTATLPADPAKPASRSRRRWIIIIPLVLLALVAIWLISDLAGTVSDTVRCTGGACVDELPGEWIGGEDHWLILNGDGSFVAQIAGQTQRGTWEAISGPFDGLEALCFTPGQNGERTCLDYEYMGDILELGEIVYYRP